MKFRLTMNSLKIFSVAVIATAMLGGTSDAQQIDWNYLNDAPVRYETGGVGGDQPGVRSGFHRTGVFMAVFEDQDSILFVDGHGNVNFDSGNWSGDIGFGYRQDLGGMVLGGNAYYNLRDYSNGISDHSFSTVGFGIEALMENWAIRSNGYLSGSERKSNGLTPIPLPTGPDLVPQVGGSTGVSNIRLAAQTENFDEALDGFDFTVTRKFPSVRSELGAGVYHLSADGGPSAWGVNGIAELWMTSNITAHVTVSHDDLFDSTAYGGLSIYFGGPAIDAVSRSGNVTSQLWSRVQRRHVAPVLNYTTDAPDLLAHDSGTGDLVTVAQIAMGDDLLGAPGLVEDDGEFIDIILVDPDATFGPMELPSTIALNDDQRLLSAHLLHGVDTAEAGIVAIPETGLPGGSAVLVGATDVDVITLANNNEVSGFIITADSGMLTASGIQGTGVTGFNINRNVITGGIDIDASGLMNISGAITENTISDGDSAGVRILGEDIELLMTSNIISGNESENVLINATGEFVGFIAINEFNDSSDGDGFQLDASTINVRFIQNIASNNDEFGFDIEVGSTTLPLEFSGNTANVNGLDGISILFTSDTDSIVDIDMNTADANLGDGISVVSTGMGDVLGSITNNTTNGNDPGIFVQSNDAASNLVLDISGNLAGGNAQEGISVFSANDFTGIVEGNIVRQNGIEGFRIDAVNNISVDVIGNDFSENDDDGLFLFAGTEIDVDLSGNVFSDNDSDGAQLNAVNITGEVSENMAFDNDEAGLFFFASNDIDLDVVNNITNDNSNNSGPADAGISLLAERNIDGLVDGNISSGNTQSGIIISADNENNHVGDVTAMVINNTTGVMGNGNGGDGVLITGENISGDITGNDADENTGTGISVIAVNNITSSLIEGNMAGVNAGNGSDGLVLMSGNNIATMLEMNTSHNNAGSGIVINAGNDFTGDVLLNMASGNTGDGIRLDATGAILGSGPGSVGVSGNTAHGNGSDGIKIESGLVGTAINSFMVENNTTGVDGMAMTGNSGIGIHVVSNGNAFVTINNNDSHGNSSGVSVVSLAGDITGDWTNNRANGNTNHGLRVSGNNAVLDYVGDVIGNTANGNDVGISLDNTLNIVGDITGNTTNSNRIGVFVDASNDFTGDVGNAVDAMLGNTANTNSDSGLFFEIGNDFTGDFVNNTATGNTVFDYDTTAGGSVTGVVSPNTSTTNNAAEFNGNIATP